MSLTRNDLQAIGTLIDQKLEPIKEELQSHGKLLEEHAKSFTNINKKLNRMNKTLDIVARTYDARIVKNTKDIGEIKDHVGLPQTH